MAATLAVKRVVLPIAGRYVCPRLATVIPHRNIAAVAAPQQLVAPVAWQHLPAAISSLLWDFLWRAVPKSKVTRSRKRMRLFHRMPKKVVNYRDCPCGKKKVQSHRICECMLKGTEESDTDEGLPSF